VALNQRRILKGLALAAPGVKPFASDFVRRFNLSTTSSAQRAIEGLLHRDLIERDDGSFVISDRFFRLWIRHAEEQ